MVTKYTEKEIEAIETKMEYPAKKVKCPRCGKELLFRKLGNSISIKCETENCIKGGLRGL